jgi:hypothetical protein
VAKRFKALIDSRAWRHPIDDDTLAKFRLAPPRPYLVGARVTYAHPVVVLACSEGEAKRLAANRDDEIAGLGNNLSTKRLTSNTMSQHLADGAKDLR